MVLEDNGDVSHSTTKASLASSLPDSTVLINWMEFCALPCLDAEMDDERLILRHDHFNLNSMAKD